MRPRKKEGFTQDHTENQGTEPGLESGAPVWDKFHPRQTLGEHAARASDGRSGVPWLIPGIESICRNWAGSSQK